MRPINKIFYRKIQLPFKVKRPILALGAQAKNTVCFIRGDSAYLSAVHPDLSNPRDFSAFEKDARHFLRKKPGIIAYDLHPEYQSTKYAQLYAMRYTLYAIQHHHAHIASCMAENGLKNQKVIGVALDGTGLGTDNTLWGAEFLLCDYKDFQRKAHLREIPLLGGEKAILEPVRVLAALGFINKIDGQKWRVLKQMYLKGLNSPLASSMGRLFDAAGSLILEKERTDFEAELAIELEKIAAKQQNNKAARYGFKIARNNKVYIIDPVLVFKGITADIKKKEPKEKMAFKFHLTIANIIKNTCLILRKETQINKVVLSGGVFQNKLLLHLSSDLLSKDGFHVVTHKDLSSNDSSISLGQAIIANFSR
jgi:hydrogenase maturation protein HypF